MWIEHEPDGATWALCGARWPTSEGTGMIAGQPLLLGEFAISGLNATAQPGHAPYV